MKKIVYLTIIALSVVTLSACGKSTKQKTASSQVSNEVSQIFKVKHADVRDNFDKIKLGTPDQTFAGGTDLEILKSYYGDPASTSQEQAGDATLDVYTWNFDEVSVNVKLFNNSAVVKSISNFAYSRNPEITLKAYDDLKTGTSFDEVVKKFGKPDVYSIAVSSDSTVTQALWSSNLVTTSGTSGTITLTFENGNLSTKAQTNLTNK